MNSFFVLYKLDRADKLIERIDRHIELVKSGHVPAAIDQELSMDIAAYRNDYEVDTFL